MFDCHGNFNEKNDIHVIAKKNSFLNTLSIIY